MASQERLPRHEPVLVDRVVELLAPALSEPGAVVLDATLGLGGHSAALLEACPHARLIGVDRDGDALALAAERLGAHADRIELVKAVYSELADVLEGCGARRVQAILFDLGVSSMQIDRPERGFAYAHDAPLDMRMDSESGLTAADVVNTYPLERLAGVLRDYGEERFAHRIARAIVDAREEAEFASSARLVAVVAAATPAKARQGGHPAKRVFQALRIEVNQELDALARALPAAVDALGVGGRIAVLAYQSLEDRMVKRRLAAGATDQAPRGLPVVPEALRPQLRLLTRGAEKPSAAEVARNPRAASARLRAAIRIKESV